MNKCHTIQSIVVNQNRVIETFFLNPFFKKLSTPKASWSFWDLQTLLKVHIKYFRVNLTSFPVGYIIATCMFAGWHVDVWDAELKVLCRLLREEHRVEVRQSCPFTSRLTDSGQITQPLWNFIFSAIKCACWWHRTGLAPLKLSCRPSFPSSFLPPALPRFWVHCPFKAWCLCALADSFICTYDYYIYTHTWPINKIRMYCTQLQNLFIHLTVYPRHLCTRAGMSRIYNLLIFLMAE